MSSIDNISPIHSNNYKYTLGSKQFIRTPLELFINNLCWGIYKFHVDGTVPSSIDIRKYYTNNMFNGTTINNLLTHVNNLVFDYKRKTNSLTPDIMSSLAKDVWNINNRIFNLSYSELIVYITSMDILDLIEIQTTPELTKAMAVVRKELSVSSIDEAYAVLEKTMSGDVTLSNNPVVKAFLGKTINFKQLRQVLGPIGFRTDINSKIFKIPIAESFTLGMNNMYSLSIESRSAARSLYFSKKAIQNSETFAKHLGLLCMSITAIDYTDCGSTKLTPMTIRSKNHPSKLGIGKSDLDDMLGKWYKDKPTDLSFKQLTKKSIDVLDKEIWIRPAHSCILKNPHHICAACYGDLAYNVPKYANVGHYSSIGLCEPMSQSILSIKHLIASAIAADIKLSKRDLLILGSKGSNYYIDLDRLKEYDKVIFKFKKSEAFVLNDVKSQNDLNKINIERASNIKNMVIELHKGDEVIKEVLTIGNVHRTGRLSLQFIAFCLKNGFEIDNRSNYVVNVNKWTFKKEFMMLPEIEFSYHTLFTEVSKLIKEHKKLKTGSKYNPDTLTYKLFDLVNSKLNVNIAYLETIVYALTTRDLANNDYFLGRNVKEPQLASLSTLLTARGFGAASAYGVTKARTIDPKAFLEKSKTDHPLDVLLTPVESLRDFDDITLGKF